MRHFIFVIFLFEMVLSLSAHAGSSALDKTLRGGYPACGDTLDFIFNTDQKKQIAKAMDKKSDLTVQDAAILILGNSWPLEGRLFEKTNLENKTKVFTGVTVTFEDGLLTRAWNDALEFERDKNTPREYTTYATPDGVPRKVKRNPYEWSGTLRTRENKKEFFFDNASCSFSALAN